MALSVAEILSDLPDIMALVQAVEDAAKAESAAASFVDKVKAAEPVLEKVAALIDKVKGQIASV